MPSTFSTNLALELIGTGDQAGSWGNTTNTNLGTLIEQAISGYVTQAVATGTDTTITIPNGSSGVARNMYIEMTGTGGASTNLIVPANKKLYFVYNNTSSGQVTVKVAGQTGVSVPNAAKMILVSNGTDIVNAENYIVGLSTTAATISTGNLTFSSTAQRITGDMSNATVANRLAFQTSTTNSFTNLSLLPNGTATSSDFRAYNNSDPTNAALAVFGTANSGTEVRLNSAITGTGTYLPMTFYTGGSERVRIDTSGNVGIGTASPVSKLNVLGPSAVTSFTGSTRLGVTVDGAASTNDYSGIDFTSGGGNLPRSRIASYFGGSGSYLQFGTSNNYGSGITNTALTIDPSGNVGIGTASPSGNFQVSAANSRIRFSNTAGTASTLLLGADSGQVFLGAETNAPIYFITNNTERMRIDSSGNVGIGRAPNYTLDVYRSGTTTPTIAAANDNIVNVLRASGNTEAVIGPITSHPLVFLSANTERMRIDTSGNVGIGTTPSKRLHVANNVTNAEFLLSSTANVYADFYLNTWALDRALIRAEAANPGSGSGTGSGALSFWTARNPTMTEAMRIDSSGNVGIGGTAQAFSKLNVAGTLPVDGQTSVSFYTDATVPSGATSEGQGFRTNLSSAAASFTLSNLRHFYARQGTIGAGSTVTNQFGFFVDSNLTGATNNYGFYSDIASGSNRWNFYAAGTAANYFAGNVGIADTGLTNVRLRVKGANTAASDYTIYSENSAATALLFVQNDGKLSTGTAANSPYNLTTASAANVYVDSSGFLYRSTSSLRYKSDVTDATHGLADVLKLRSVTYKGKDGGGTVFGGLIAEEVHDAGLTEFVAYDSEGRPDALHYGNMVALLVKAIQQLTARVATLEAK